ncbi:MAG TPA: pyridoxamine 5'-phosphate oxidase family protein [Bacteroidales bacterium]|nr:pyridoxamine 5'-phosphate oxidase family protein [Bacteroidales bacterium]
MRRSEREIKDNTILEKILKHANICRIAFSVRDTPYIVPLNYGYYNGKLYIHSAKAGKKIDLIKANPYVCFEIEYGYQVITAEKACGWTAQYASIIGYGEFKIVTAFADKLIALKYLMAQFDAKQSFTFNEKSINEVLILELTIKEMSGKMSGDIQFPDAI